MSIDTVERLKQTFDTVLLLGNNWGLLRSPKQAKRILKLLYKKTSDRAIIIAETSDPGKQSDADQLEYQKTNTQNGKLPGQRKIRIRYRSYKTNWFEYLGVTKQEMENILKDTGWQVGTYIDSERAAFIAIIEKAQ
jgi:hypothetical protein